MGAENAKITAEALCETDLPGTSAHGTKNLYGYVKKKRAGGMDLKSEPELLTQGPSYAPMAYFIVTRKCRREIFCKYAHLAGLHLKQ